MKYIVSVGPGLGGTQRGEGAQKGKRGPHGGWRRVREEDEAQRTVVVQRQVHGEEN